MVEMTFSSPRCQDGKDVAPDRPPPPAERAPTGDRGRGRRPPCRAGRSGREDCASAPERTTSEVRRRRLSPAVVALLPQGPVKAATASAGSRKLRAGPKAPPSSRRSRAAPRATAGAASRCRALQGLGDRFLPAQGAGEDAGTGERPFSPKWARRASSVQVPKAARGLGVSSPPAPGGAPR